MCYGEPQHIINDSLHIIQYILPEIEYHLYMTDASPLVNPRDLEHTAVKSIKIYQQPFFLCYMNTTRQPAAAAFWIYVCY